MFSTYICSVLSFQRKVVHKTTTANMFGNKLFLWLGWKYSIFKRFIHTLCIAKIIPIYTNLTKCQNYLKCKCKRSRLHPTEPTASVGFTLRHIKHNIFVLIVVLLTSCSGEYHLRQAFKKGALTEDVVMDTITEVVTKHDTVYDFIEIPYETLVVKDSIWCDSNNLPQSIGANIKEGRIGVEAELLDNIYTVTANCDSLREKYQKIVRVNSYISNKIKKERKFSDSLKQQLAEKEDYFWHFIGAVLIIGVLSFLLIKKNFLL